MHQQGRPEGQDSTVWESYYRVSRLIPKDTKLPRDESPLRCDLHSVRFQPAYLCYRDLFKSPLTAEKDARFYNEAISDHISLRVSVDALRYYQKKRPTEFRELPFKSLSANQNKMLYITRSYAMCWATNFVNGWDNPTHPPRFHRVNRGLANFKHFQDTFGCLDGDPMVSVIRCPFLNATLKI